MIYGTGIHNPKRVLALISAPGVAGVGISDDYGATFSIIDGMQVFENSANPNALYGVRIKDATSGRRALYMSSDEGHSWDEIVAASPIFKSLYREGNDLAIMRTWRRFDADSPQDLPFSVIQQLESDPHDEKRFYVLSQYKGIYRTIDGGSRFEVLPIAADKYLEVESMALDPIDSRYLYVILGSRELFRSHDYGCSWERVKLPPE